MAPLTFGVRSDNLAFQFFCFYAFFGVIFALIMIMDQMECILHCVRLIWVEFMNKFYSGTGVMFGAYDLTKVLNETIDEE
jgi:V-type H+-transporting ATPase subunit a